MSFSVKFRSLVWKNIQLRKRQKVRCVIELVWPLILVIILFWLRTKTKSTNVRECYFTQRSLPSVGSFAFIQSAICTFDNVCQHSINDTQVKTESFSPTVPEFIEDLEKNSSSFQTSVAELYRFLCGNQTSNLLNRILEDPNLKPSDTESTTENVNNQKKLKETYVSNNTEACNEKFKIFEKDDTLKYFWWMVKPFVRGKLLYAPSTPATDRIMNRFQTAFTYWKQISKTLFNEIIPEIVKMKNSTSSLLNYLKFKKSTLERLLLKDSEANRNILENQDILNLMQKLNLLQTKFPNMTEIFECVEFDKVKGFSDEETALATAMPLLETNSLLALIVFINSGNETLNPRVTYKIRMDEQRVDDTYYVQDSLWNANPRIEPFWDEKYIKYGFAYIQDMLDNYIIEEQTKKKDMPGIILQEFPFPCYVKDSFNDEISFMFPLIMVLSWSFTCAMIIKYIVYEKEKRLKETMKMMGLGNFIHWLGWFVDSFLSMLVTICLLTIMLKYGEILEGVSLTLLFVFLTLYGFATISLAFLISTFFSRANLSAAAGAVIFFALYIPYPFLERWSPYLSPIEKCFVSLSSNVAFGVGSSYLAKYAQQGIGASWENIFESPVNGDNFNFAYIMIMLLVDIFIYLSITFYIEAVFPGQYGISKPWYFPFIRHPQRKWIDDASGSLYAMSSINYETEPHGLTLGVSINDLGLVYSNGKVAVNGLKLNFYEDQITSLLGHNGAGKTSTISVLTGLFPPTHGTVNIYEHDLHTSMEKIYGRLGVCPQHNIIFDLLTVEEHLWFYSQLRCQRTAKAKLEVKMMIEDIGLSKHRSTIAAKLSGGMQRKLSVAAAFIGGPKIVILDEPTSSVDPYSRRAIWDLLIKYKKGRTIILTTHSMDEADMLSDRIAIMVNGHVECYGTSLFLKDQFGSGFRLAVEMGYDFRAEDPSRAMERNIKELTKLVGEIVPSARLIEQKDASISFTIPNRNDSKALQNLFSTLDKRKNLFFINSYNISDTSLEEIFLRVTEKADPPSPHSSSKSDVINNNRPVEESTRTYFKEWSWSHLCALFMKRYHHMRRSKKAMFSELFLPSVFIYVAMFTSSLEPSLEPRPILPLTPWVYSTPRYMFYENKAINLSTWNTIMEEIFGTLGLGTRCLPDFRNQNCLNSTDKMWWYNHPEVSIDNFGPNCSCNTGIQVCPAQAEDLIPPSTQLVSGDTVFDLSGSNVSNFLVKTYNKYERSLFGGYSLGVPSPILESYNYGSTLNSFTADSFSNSLPSLNIKVWYNNKAWVSSVAYMNAIKNILLRSYLSTGNLSSYGIDAFNHPMPYTEKQKVLFKLDKEQVAVFHAIALLFALSFVPASFTAYLVEERASSSKHLQLVSGLGKPMYWLHIITWDLICYTVSCTLCVCSFLLLQEQAYISSPNFSGLISLLYMYGFSCIPLMYPLSFLFSVPSTAFVATACGNMILSLSTMSTTILMDRFQDDKDLSEISTFLEKIFLVFPHFALGNGIKKLVFSYMNYKISSLISAVPPAKPNVFVWDFLGKNLCAMAVIGCLFFLITFLIEYKFFQKLFNLRPKKLYTSPPPDVDDDVASEKKRINAGDVEEDVLVIKNLCKMYKKNGYLEAVVNHINLGIKKGECFGLLGLNGAGKTVTLKMLSGKIQSTWGDAAINGWSVSTNLKRVQSLIGYCPQFDALDNLLTPKEHLEFYARIRNIPCSEVKQTVAESLETFGLVRYKDCVASKLSGGNKRKLSNAIAVMGKPPLLLLDEPTSGMDPKSRRFLRSCIKDLVHQGHSIILTSHSMEECQELCTRLTIMVNGQFKCLGSPQYLKNKYGKGYSLILNCKQDTIDIVKKTMAAELSSGKLTEEKLSHLSYQLPKETVQLNQVFQTIQMIRNYLKDFSVCQTTLEEVFLILASEQSPDNKTKKSIFTRLFRIISRRFSRTGSLDIST